MAKITVSLLPEMHSFSKNIVFRLRFGYIELALMVCILLSGLGPLPERMMAAQGEASYWECGGLEKENFGLGLTNLLAETSQTFPRLFCLEAELEFSDDFESDSDSVDQVGQSHDKSGIFSHFLFGNSKSAFANFILNLQNRASVPLFVLFHSWKGFTA